MKEFLLSEKYRLEIHWTKVVPLEKGVSKVEGCYLSGPVLNDVVGLNKKDRIALDFRNQYRIFVPSFYILRLSWDGFRKADGKFFLDNVRITNNNINFVPNLKDNDYIVVDTSKHDTAKMNANDNRGTIPMVYVSYLIKEDKSLYNFEDK